MSRPRRTPRSNATSLHATALVGAACVAACDAGAPQPPAPGPAPRIVRTDTRAPGDAGVDGGALPVLARDRALTFDTDRLLAPRTVSRGTVAVTSGELRLSGNLRYDPARRRVAFVPEPGQMRAGLEYVFTVQPGLAAWDGTPTGVLLQEPFIAGVETSPPAPPPTRPTLRADVAPLLARRCAVTGCHGGPEAVMALDLSSARAIVNTTVGVLARERGSDRGGGAERTDPRWGPLERVERGEPGYSYLLYKILGDGPLLGARMPPAPAPALTPDEVALVSDWIERGAPDD